MPSFKKRRVTRAIADRLADAIAHRALEGEVEALNERQVALSMKAYAGMFGVVSFEAACTVAKRMPQWMLTTMPAGDSTAFWFRVPETTISGANFDLFFREPVLLPLCDSATAPTGQVTLAAMDKLNADRKALALRRRLLIDELSAQMMTLGDTHRIAAAWPEAESLVAHAVTEALPRTVQPLGELLGRFATPLLTDDSQD